MAVSVGVLCTRGRVEEKLLTAALVEAGFAAFSVAPAPGPAPLGSSPGWPLASDSASGATADIVIDRLQDRALASAVVSLWNPDAIGLIDAGAAATGNRLTIADALASAGVPRPFVFASHDEASGVEAANQAGYPATFLPFEPKSPGLILWDLDTAEAVLEHREMLGARSDTLGMIQAGTGADSIRIIVCGGTPIGFEGNESLAIEATFALALAAAAALNAELAGIVLVESDEGPVIWDVDPAPDFRNATPIAAPSVAAAIVERVRELASARSGGALIGR